MDHWSDQKIWDKVLLNIRIVVSTPQVLLDARSRGFVHFSRIALLVFDEAHHCADSHPMNNIMQKFYHPFKESGDIHELPSVMALTASPLMKLDLQKNLNAVVRSPTIHREELLQYVHQPILMTVTYQTDGLHHSPLLLSLESLVAKALTNIENDPEIRRLRDADDLESMNWLSKLLLSEKKTPCQKELDRFLGSSSTIHDELGPWAADLLIRACIERFLSRASSGSEDYALVDWESDEKRYITSLLSQINLIGARQWCSTPDILSEKANLLVQTLAEEYSPGYRVIVFAKERNKVVMLAHLLSVHPLMDKIVPGYFIGNSNHASRKSKLSEFFDIRDQKNAIDDLRRGKKNVLVATTVLEEGIDVSACNLVICYDNPSDLKGFVQRRGRARMRGSKFVMFIDKDDPNAKKRLVAMEYEMKKLYSDNKHRLEEIQHREMIQERGYEVFTVPSTGARLDYDNARPYLEHFCSTVSYSYSDNRPDFIMHQYFGDSGLMKATAILPGFLDPSLREICGQRSWMTERNAKREAAFQAYLALYQAGLVNDNLMPKHCEKRADLSGSIDSRPSTVQGVSCSNPWVDIGRLWTAPASPAIFETEIIFSPAEFGVPSLVLLTPACLPVIPSFKLYWNKNVTLTVSLKSRLSSFPSESIPYAIDATYQLLHSAFPSRVDTSRTDFLALFVPDIPSLGHSIGTWLTSVQGIVSAEDVRMSDPDDFRGLGIARDNDRYGRPFVIEEVLWKVPTICEGDDFRDNETRDDGEEQPLMHIQGTALPKRTDFLHLIPSNNETPLHHTSKHCALAQSCSVDRLPVAYARAALFIPSVIHEIGVGLLAQKLSCTLLASVGFNDLSLVMAAICASAAREQIDYQRLEFLGDNVLKFTTAVQIMAANQLWHEGLLSCQKDKLVSNAPLSRAALDTGLHEYIITTPFTGNKWRPTYISDIIKPATETEVPKERELSTKVLADVVEALIGAAFVDGGVAKAIQCLRLFLPHFEWWPMGDRINQLYDAVPEESKPFAHLSQVEQLIGYTFTKRTLLVEALTHPCSRDDYMSYQRLEFLGDSVLDHIVTRMLFTSGEIPHAKMHLMRTALVNADFLAFLCLDSSLNQTRMEITNPDTYNKSIEETVCKAYLWQFMRHSASSEIKTAQQTTTTRFTELRQQIYDALYNADAYPWALLSRLGADKFFSDLIESILGAIFIDSHGSVDACNQFLEKIGLLRYMQRILNQEIDCLHPKERVGHVAQSLRVSYDTKKEIISDHDDEKIYKWLCSVTVGDEVIVELTDGVNPIEVETRAAAAVVDILKARYT
ncbi:conserved hypothetical protein [Paecilomyces variotii No. 5]|uniref:Dicer-like protein 2 n=1 Tax=Byssochlamys spectabilis (strain No. 5 / NBRC 109023) TaxID=1356009 RepID=V5FR99_BYSSN|nr:conserved hypothetical protein [Paecilomyces variotii No. 5]